MFAPMDPAQALATVALAPVLLVQGRRVRRDTPKLPEAEGPREGTLGDGDPLRLLMVGDSAAAGVGAATQSEAMAGLLTRQLAQRFSVSWSLIAKSGVTTGEMLRQLQGRPLPACDVAVVALGLNDVTALRSLGAWLADVNAVIALLRSRAGAEFIVLSGIPPMHHFPALPQPLRWYLGRGAQRFDRALEGFPQREPGALAHVPLRMRFSPEYMASDGFHPGPAGHALWAGELARCISAWKEQRSRQRKSADL